jgi:hypothetical protein
MVMKKLLLPVLGAIAVAGGGLAYYQFNQPQSALDPQALASAVPDEAVAAAFISTNAQTWSQLEQFGTPEARQLVQQNLETLQHQALAGTSLTYEKDLKPWVGNAMIALLPAQKQAPNALIVVGIRSKKAAWEFANKLNSESKVKSTESDYKGVQISSFPGDKLATHTAVVKDFVVLSSERQVVERAIDTLKGEPSFAQKADVQAFLRQPVTGQATIARFYVPDYTKAIQASLQGASKSAQFTPEMLEQLQRVTTITGDLGVEREGLRFKAISNLNAQFANAPYSPVAGTIVGQFPSETLGLVSGAGLNRTWSQVLEQSNSLSKLQLAVGMMRQYTKFVGLDLDRDVFGWMDGEFAIGLLPSDQGVLAALGFGGAMILDTSDRPTAENMFSKLDLLARTSAIQVEQRQMNGKTVTEWRSPQGTVLTHGWLDQDSVFVALGDAAEKLMTPKQALNTSENFQTLTASLPKQNLGYVYVDVEKSLSLMQRPLFVSQQAAMPPETRALLESVRGIGLTTTQPTPTRFEAEMLLSLKPAK